MRFAGSGKWLNFVDYGKVDDPAALHRWTGNRLLLLAMLVTGLATCAWRLPAQAFLFVLFAFVLMVATWIWIAVGSGRFQNQGIPAHQHGDRS